jgi:transaldolase
MIDTAVTAVAHHVSRKDFSHQFGRPKVLPRRKAIWSNVRDLGTRLWLDTGDIEEAERLWCSDFEALTTNNTLLNKEVQKGIYDKLIRETAEAIRRVSPKIDEQRLVLEIAFVLNAYHGLRLVEKFDAYVSVEVHTDLGHDVERTVAYGKRYYDICPQRFYVKIPFTPAGLLATRELSQLGAPVNFTLGFSARQNYLTALFAKPAFVNVFMGRLNVFIFDNGLGDGKNVGEKATLATQRELLELRNQKRTQSLLIGASMREGAQIPALGGVDVFTMPPKVAAQYEQNPIERLPRQVEQDPPVALAEFARVEDVGIETLWDIPERFRKAVDELLEQDIETLTPAEICTYFAHAGYPDFLPDYSEDDILTATADGKIPIYDKWRDRLARGEIGLDALMNLSAFRSFATDQNALDTRIRSLL